MKESKKNILKVLSNDGKPKHISRHAFEDSDRLSLIVVPASMTEAFQKALHYDAIGDEYLIAEGLKAKRILVPNMGLAEGLINEMVSSVFPQ